MSNVHSVNVNSYQCNKLFNNKDHKVNNVRNSNKLNNRKYNNNKNYNYRNNNSNRLIKLKHYILQHYHNFIILIVKELEENILGDHYLKVNLNIYGWIYRVVKI